MQKILSAPCEPQNKKSLKQYLLCHESRACPKKLVIALQLPFSEYLGDGISGKVERNTSQHCGLLLEPGGGNLYAELDSTRIPVSQLRLLVATRDERG